MKMTATELIEMSVTNTLSQDYTNLDDLPSPTCTEFDLASVKIFLSVLVVLLLILINFNPERMSNVPLY